MTNHHIRSIGNRIISGTHKEPVNKQEKSGNPREKGKTMKN